jgi:hypothetical protein
MTGSADSGTVMLRTGARVPREAALAIWLNIRTLRQRNWIALYEAVLLARHPGYVLAADSVTTLHAWSVLGGDGLMRDTVRAVLLAATEGDGAEMILRSPFADTEAAGEG